MPRMQGGGNQNTFRHAEGRSQGMSLPTTTRDILAFYETLKVIRKGSEDDFELRATQDESVWGVRVFDENPNKPTYVIYAGPDAKEPACDLADYDVDEQAA